MDGTRLDRALQEGDRRITWHTSLVHHNHRYRSHSSPRRPSALAGRHACRPRLPILLQDSSAYSSCKVTRLRQIRVYSSLSPCSSISENDSRIDLSVRHPRTWTIMRAGPGARQFSAESRCKHVVSPRLIRASPIEVWRPFCEQERKLLGHVHKDQILLHHVGVSIGEGEDHLDDPARAAKSRRQHIYRAEGESGFARILT